MPKYYVKGKNGKWFLGFREGSTRNIGEAYAYSEAELRLYWNSWGSFASGRPTLRQALS